MTRIFSLLLAAILFTSCCDQKKESAKEEQPSEPLPGNKVSITTEQMTTAGITLGSIEHKNLENAVRANGLLTVPNQNKAFITSVTSGVIQTLNIRPGSFVRKGQAVATIANPDIVRHQQELQTTNARIELAETEYKRQQELVEGAAAPLKNLQRAQTELITLKAARNSLQQQLTAMGVPLNHVRNGDIVTTLTITAPLKGTISNVLAQIGSNIDASTPIAEIVNNDQLHLDLFVYEKDLPQVQARQTIHFTLTNHPGKEYDAQIFSIGTAFASETKTIPIHAVVKGDKAGLIEGMNITALISVGKNVSPAVPDDAIVNYLGRDYIFITPGKQHDKDSSDIVLERVPVVKGVSDVGYTGITLLKDIPAESLVVSKGAFFVLAKMTNTGHEE